MAEKNRIGRHLFDQAQPVESNRLRIAPPPQTSQSSVHAQACAMHHADRDCGLASVAQGTRTLPAPLLNPAPDPNTSHSCFGFLNKESKPGLERPVGTKL